MKKSEVLLAVFLVSVFISTQVFATLTEFTDEAAFRAVAGPLQDIDFETYGDGNSVLPGDQAVEGDEWSNLGIHFAAAEIGYSQLLSAKTDMNVPAGTTGHALAIAGLSPGDDRSSHVITFSSPVISFGVYIVDNETSSPTERIILKDDSGNVLGDFPMPGGAGAAPPLPVAHDFIGYTSTIPIAEVSILEDNDNEGSLLDNVMYTPEPATLSLLLISSLAIFRRRAK